MIKIKQLKKIFNQGTINEKTVIDNIDLTINDGDFISLIGANGSGKSTLLNCISGALIPEQGNIILDGKDITLDSQHARAHDIGHLFQDPMAGTAPHMSIEENLALAAKSGSWLAKINENDRNRFKKILSELNMDLENKLQVEVGLLSGGMRQALTLVMATINVPKLLLLDEHTAALDPQSADKIMQLTKDVVEKNNLTCMMVTHNMQSALDYGNRLLMMHQGKIIIDLNKQEKEKLTVNDLRELFKKNSDTELSTDRMLLV